MFPQTDVAGKAVTAGVPLVTESDTPERGQVVDVSVMVNLTESGAGPEDGTASSLAFVPSAVVVVVVVVVAVLPLTLIVTV